MNLGIGVFLTLLAIFVRSDFELVLSVNEAIHDMIDVNSVFTGM